MQSKPDNYQKLRKHGSIQESIIDFYDQEIIGQDHVKKLMAKVLSDIHQDLNYYQERPLSVLFFKGPTGVGKTEIVKQTARLLFGDKMGFVNINCEQLRMSHEGSATLFGAPAGYLGYDKKPRLHPNFIHQARKVGNDLKQLHKIAYQKYNMSIILFDEIEKMHPETINSLLSLIDEGIVRLKSGITVDLRNSIIIFTSNVGEAAAENAANTVGFGNHKNRDDEKRQAIKDKIFQKTFAPEFRGRLDHVIEFEPLSVDFVDQLLEKYKKKLIADVLYINENLLIQYSNDFNDHMKSKISTAGGYRTIDKTWNNYVRNTLGSVLKINRLTKTTRKNILEVYVDNEEIDFKLKEDQYSGLVHLNEDRSLKEYENIKYGEEFDDDKEYNDGRYNNEEPLTTEHILSILDSLKKILPPDSSGTS